MGTVDRSSNPPSSGRWPAARGIPALVLALLALPACSGDSPAPAPEPPAASSAENAAAAKPEGYRVEFLELEPQTTAVMRFTAAPEEAIARIDRARSEVWKHCDARGIEITGPPFNRISEKGGAFEVETGWVVAGPFEPEGEVLPGQLPGGPIASVLHRGPYEGMNVAVETLLEWLQESGMASRGEMWVSFEERGVHDPDPATWETRVLLPIQEPAS